MSRLKRLFFPLLKMPRWQKRVVSLTIDFIALLLLAFLALTLRFGDFNWPTLDHVLSGILLPIIAIPIFIRLGLYRSIIRYISIRFAYIVFMAVTISIVFWAAALFMFDLALPRTAIVIAWLLALLFISGTRIIARSLLTNDLHHAKHLIKNRVLIYGAGAGGQQLFNALSKIPTMQVVGFIDDNIQLQNQDIYATKVFKPSELESLIDNRAITDVFLAIPSLLPQTKKQLLKRLEPLKVKVSIVPPIDKIVGGEIQFSDVREVEIEDLLGREVVPPKQELLAHCIKDKVVLVSGAGGSIGSELCRQLIKQKPKLLILYELSEFALYAIDKELQGNGVEVLAILGTVQNAIKLDELFKRYSVDTVYHAAAYKHVPLVEHNIAEGIQNNSFATLTIAKAAAENTVKNFVLISTDKAVRPTNFMGASKRMAELALQALQKEFSQTCFVMVRFGNVLGSSGSVIPLFREQIKSGGPLTVTHPEITRFFMTIPEAASLVIQAGSMGQGGDVFVLDMGEPVKIIDLATRMVRLSGLEVMNEQGQGDIEIQFTGLRPGEKLYEELLIGDDVDGTDHPKIMRANEYAISLDILEKKFADIDMAMGKKDFVLVSQLIGDLVKGFNHNAKIVDYLVN